jgi:transcriptional regulator with XRE-family HTH domain
VVNVGDRLKEERTLKGWSQRDLAEESGTNVDTISGIERGQHEPRPSTLRKLAAALGVQVRDLFEEPVLPGKAEASPETGPTLLDKVVEAALQDDEERGRKAINREKASQGVREGADAVVSAFAEDKVRAELREAGVTDEIFEDLIRPLAERAAWVALLKRENARLEEEVAGLREGAGAEKDRAGATNS